MNRIRWYGPSILLLIALVTVMLTGPNLMRQLAWARDDTRITLIRDTLPEMPALAELSNAFKLVAESVEPSVVHIQAEQPLRSRGSVFIPRAYPSGSGWVYDEQGHIVTNNHVVEGASRITVKFADGSERHAELVGGDPKTDVAVIKVDAGGLHPAVVAEEHVQKGDIVFAFGSPLHFEFSMSQGIVSATGRQLGLTSERGRYGAIRGYEDFIQTDAAINPGNSGGPLTNIYGQVIGMNTAIASDSPGRRPDGGYMPAGFIGLGFAIPVYIIVPVADQIIANNGRVERGYMGVYISDLSPAMAQTYGYDGQGVLVDDPVANQPGYAAGIRQGDIITKIEDHPVHTAEELRFAVASFPPGSEISVELFRNGEVVTTKVALVEHPDNRVSELTTPPRTGDEAMSVEEGTSEALSESVLLRDGLGEVSEFTAEMAAQMRAEYTPGVLVTRIVPGSPAEDAMLQPLHIITHVMGQPVATPDELVAALEAQPDGKPVRLRVAVWDQRDRRFLSKFIVLEPDLR